MPRPHQRCRVPCLSWSSSPVRCRRTRGIKMSSPGRTSSTGTVVDPGADPGQPAPLCPGVRARAWGRRRGAGQCGLEHRRRLDRPERRVGYRRREHHRRPRGHGHPHPPRSLRVSRQGEGGIGGMDRPAPGRRGDAGVPLRRQRPTGGGHVRPAGGVGGARREAARPGLRRWS